MNVSELAKMEKILRERLVENQEKIEMIERTQSLMERALEYLVNRAWSSANIDGLCDRRRVLVAATTALGGIGVAVAIDSDRGMTVNEAAAAGNKTY